ncbi:MAG: DUF447 family protein [Candidatus Micrarchaeia archaeon]
MRVDLKRIGMERGWIYEGIVSTYSPEGQAHAAPMGFRSDDLKTIVVRPYKDTQSYINIRAKGCFVLNFVDDVGEFYTHIFEPEKAGMERFRRTDIDAPALSCAPAYWQCKVLAFKEDGSGRGTVTAEIIDGVGRPVLLSRAPALALECIIAATKLGVDAEKDAFLKQFLEETAALIARVAPGSRYEEIARACLAHAKG